MKNIRIYLQEENDSEEIFHRFKEFYASTFADENTSASGTKKYIVIILTIDKISIRTSKQI